MDTFVAVHTIRPCKMRSLSLPFLCLLDTDMTSALRAGTRRGGIYIFLVVPHTITTLRMC